MTTALADGVERSRERFFTSSPHQRGGGACATMFSPPTTSKTSSVATIASLRIKLVLAEEPPQTLRPRSDSSSDNSTTGTRSSASASFSSASSDTDTDDELRRPPLQRPVVRRRRKRGKRSHDRKDPKLIQLCATDSVSSEYLREYTPAPPPARSLLACCRLVPDDGERKVGFDVSYDL